MKSRIAILFAVVAALVAASPASAVPAKPVDATAIMLLPAERTPDELRKLVVAFGKRITEVNASAETKREQLQKQMKDGFEKAIAKAQSSGDIDSVLALKAAKDQFDTIETSDVPVIKNAIAFREKKTSEIETARFAEAMKAAKEFNDELEKAKKDETTKGNFETAKAMADNQKKLLEWVQQLKATEFSSRPPLNSSNSIQQNRQDLSETVQPVLPTTSVPITKVLKVDARREKGASIGNLKAGDVIQIKYISGEWFFSKNDPKVNPDEHFGSWGLAQTVLSMGPKATMVEGIPKGTSETPFEFMVEESGEYQLRIKDQGTDDNAGIVQYEVKILSAGQTSTSSTSGNNHQLATNDGNRQQEQRTFLPGSQSRKTIAIDSSKDGGTSIGFVKEGDTIRIRYVSGKWTSNQSGEPKSSPDSVDSGPSSLVLAIAPKGFIVAQVPRNTVVTPFEFTVEKPGKYQLRINDTGTWDNEGIVRYEVEIIAAGTR